jgi:putative ABC transport system permease protein
MLGYNLKTAFKFFRKNLVFTTINILGLSIALAVSFIIILFVVNELSYNNSHKKRQRIYKVLSAYNEGDVTSARTPYAMAPTMLRDYPQVSKSVATRNMSGFTILKNHKPITVKFPLATGSQIFDIFTIPLVSSLNPSDPIDDKYALCLSESMAHKLFGAEDPIGKEVIATSNNQEQLLKVTTVYEDLPENSSLEADCMIHIDWTVEEVNQFMRTTDAEDNWVHNFWITWILLDENTTPQVWDDQLNKLEENYLAENSEVSYKLQNLTDVYLHSEDINNVVRKGSIKDVALFAIIALLIVVVAAMNYVILTSAVSTGRLKEFAIRKTNGARSHHILRQILTESLLFILLVLPFSLYFLQLGLPYASELFQQQIPIIGKNVPIYIVVYFILSVLIVGASALYINLWISKKGVVGIFKSPVNTGKSRNYFRAMLIIFQLVIFSSFVSSMLIIHNQRQFVLNMDPRFQNQHVIFLEVGEDFPNYNALIQWLENNPYVEQAGGTYETLPTRTTAGGFIPHATNSEKQVLVNIFDVEVGFMETLNVPLVEGRYFSSGSKSQCMLNKTAVDKLGLKDPIGKSILGSYEVVGVVKDFYYNSIHREIEPLLIFSSGSYIQQVAIAYKPGSLNDLLPPLKKTWNNLAPDTPFHYQQVETLIQRLYKNEKNLLSIITIAAVFVLLIATMGLFALTLFLARRRTKEIGVRKVLGCSTKRIVFSFVAKNLLYVTIAVAISIPVTIMVMNDWLNNYVERISMGWEVFALTFIIAALIVVSTVLIHAYKSARVNPVEVLRDE